MKDLNNMTIFILGLVIGGLLGFPAGMSVTSTPQTTYNNTQAVTDCATTLNRCMEGWRETLDTLNSCNNLIK